MRNYTTRTKIHSESTAGNIVEKDFQVEDANLLTRLSSYGAVSEKFLSRYNFGTVVNVSPR